MRRWVVLALIFAGILISYLDRGNLSLAAVPVMREFGYSAAAMGVLLSCFFWTYGFFQVPSGILIDRFGIKWIYATAFLLWSLASASVGLSRGFATFLVARLVLGVAESVSPIASLSYIRQNFSAKEQGFPLGVYLAGTTLGPAAGTLLGAHLLDSLGWRPLFILTGLGALVWLLPWVIAVPVAVPIAVPAAVPKAAAATNRNTTSTMLSSQWPKILAHPAALVMGLFVFLFSYYWYFVLSWVPAYLVLVHKFSTIEMGNVLSVPLFCMAVFAIGGGALTDYLARITNQAIGVRVWFLCAGMLGSSTILLLVGVSDRRWVMPILMLSTCSTALTSTNYWSLAQILVPAEMIGRSIGYLNTIAQVAGAAAPLVTGWILGPSQRFNLALIVAGTCPLIAAFSAAALGTRRLHALRSLTDSLIAPSIAGSDLPNHGESQNAR